MRAAENENAESERELRGSESRLQAVGRPNGVVDPDFKAKPPKAKAGTPNRWHANYCLAVCGSTGTEIDEAALALRYTRWVAL